MQLCRWTYGDAPDSSKVEIFVNVQPVTIGPGYALNIEYQAHAFELTAMTKDAYGNEKQVWAAKHVEQFFNVEQTTVQAQVALGLDPLLELYKTDAPFRTLLGHNFPRLESSYANIVIGLATPLAIAPLAKPWTAL